MCRGEERNGPPCQKTLDEGIEICQGKEAGLARENLNCSLKVYVSFSVGTKRERFLQEGFLAEEEHPRTPLGRIVREKMAGLRNI